MFKENTPMSTAVLFTPFSATNLPPYQTPLLVQLTLNACKPFAKSRDKMLASRDQLAGEVFYGYVVCILAYDTDGFGNRFPSEFRRIDVKFHVDDGKRPCLGESIPFSDVVAWAAL